MPKSYKIANVFDAALDRLLVLYEAGHRVVVSFSAGKDSGICLELCRIAANITGRGPVEVVMRDEEIMYPGTFEYAARVAQMPDVKFYWFVANQPIINVYNRKAPYFWVFDPLLKPEDWVRTPPDYAIYIKEKYIQGLTDTNKFPPAKGKNLYAVLGLRTSESMNRKMGLMSSKGYLTQPNSFGTSLCRPIYDWEDGDVWKAIHDNKWDYNDAYDVMNRLGVPKNRLRIAPPTLTAASIEHLNIGMKAFPKWFDKVSDRLPGIKSAAQFGRRSVEPLRRSGETWEDCFYRTCIKEAPAWIAERAQKAVDYFMKRHASHSTQPFNQVTKCVRCGQAGCWRALGQYVYGGDPFSMKLTFLPVMQPEFFREGSGQWGGKPTW